jgi:flagellar hook-length control protein FliK
LQVVLKIGNDQVDTTFISDNPEVRQALQDGMHHLKDKMNESGIQLGNTNISSNAQSQQDFQQAMQGREQANSSHHHQASIEAESIQVAPTMIKVQAAKGLVDTFA